MKQYSGKNVLRGYCNVYDSPLEAYLAEDYAALHAMEAEFNAQEDIDRVGQVF